MKNLLGLIFLLGLSAINAQNNRVVVTSSLSGEPLYHAYVINKSNNTQVAADESGVARIGGQVGDSILVSYVGYRDTGFILIENISQYSVGLMIQTFEEVVIFAEEAFNRKAALGRHDVSMELLTAVPSLTGDADILKTITFLPGVTAGREGYSHLFVRGGEQDQNQILYDGASLYNVNHFGGFISMFNSEMIGSVDFYKSYWPSQFGGRLSSVLDVRSEQGNYKKHQQTVDIGFIYSKAKVTGPLWRDKVSYNIGARRTFIDLLTGPRIRKAKQGTGQEYALNVKVFDLNARIDARLSKNQHLALSYLQVKDVIENYTREFGDNSTEDHLTQNRILALNYSWYINNVTTVKAHVSHSSYAHNYTDKIYSKDYIYGNIGPDALYEVDIFNRYSGNKVTSKKLNITGATRLWDAVELDFGLAYENLDYLVFLDRSDQFETNGIVSTVDAYSGQVKQDHARTYSTFLDGLYSISSRWRVKAGIRFPYYSYREYSLWLPEPKVSTIFDLNDETTVNLSFNIQQQSTTMMGYLNEEGYYREFYIANQANLPTSLSRQWSMGLFRSFNHWIDNFSVEIFYKKQTRLGKFLPASNLDRAVIQYRDFFHLNGVNQTYGIELLAQKTAGKIHASIAYTYSKSLLTYSSLNVGRPFAADFDFTHNANILLVYKFGKGYKLATSWNYKSGRPFTLPVGLSPADGLSRTYAVITKINNARMPPFHRLDLSLDREWLTVNKGKRQWIGISVYNAYNRINPFHIGFEEANKIKVTGLFPIIPSLHFGFEI